MKSLKVHISENLDVFYNLALEDHFFRNLEKEEVILFFWRSSPSIVMGRFQNAFKEINHLIAKEHNLKIARRQSGGGCVYHDPGNLNFTFIHNKEDYNVDQNIKVLIDSLAVLGVKAYTTPRHDLRVGDNLKITGSAFKQTKWANYHHGTLLIESDLELLNSSLLAMNKNMQDKAINSVRSTVTNLIECNKEISKEIVIKAIIEQWENLYQLKSCEKTFDDFNVRKFSSWDWTYGENPKFNLTIVHKDLSFKFLIKKGLVAQIEVNSTVQHTLLLNDTFQNLITKKFAQVEFFSILEANLMQVIDELEVEEYIDSIKQQILG